MPLTAADLNQLDIVQRRMLRSVVGWVRVPDEPWKDTMLRMNARVQAALQYHPIINWKRRFAKKIVLFCNEDLSNTRLAKKCDTVVPLG